MKKLMLFTWLLLVGGCSNSMLGTNNIRQQNVDNAKFDMKSQVKPPLAQGSIHYYVEQLAKQLFSTAQEIDASRTVAVGTFLPMSALRLGVDGKNSPVVNPIGYQIQESFVTFATQVGLNIVEFKTMATIKIKANSDRMLSRQLNELQRGVGADYFLTGTYAEQESSLVVNVRLIDVQSQQVIAAATDYIPANSMWQPSTNRMKGNLLYRTER